MRSPVLIFIGVCLGCLPAGSAVLYSGGTWDFEAGFYSFPEYDRIGTVGNEWNWWSGKLEYQGSTYGFGTHNENKWEVNVSSGIRSQEITMTCATGWAGIYRTIPVPAGHRIRITYDAKTTWSESPALIFLGTNLTGGTDRSYLSFVTQWHPWGGGPGPWVHASKTVVSTGPAMTVFIALRHEVPSCTGATFLVDNVQVHDDGPDISPTVTFTPSASPTGTASPTPSPSITPTPTGDTDQDGILDTDEREVPPSGRTNLYLPDSDGDGLSDGNEDLNRNGLRDPGEPNARVRDSDGDGYEDGIEGLLAVSDPLDPGLPLTEFVDGDADALPVTLDSDDADPDLDHDRFQDGYEETVRGIGSSGIPSQKPDLGDVDGTGIWDNADSQLILNFFARIPGGRPMDPGKTDLDRNGVIDNADSQHSLNYFGAILPMLPRPPLHSSFFILNSEF